MTHMQGVPYTGNTKGFRPKRDRVVHAREVVCPECDAEVGDQCLSSVTGRITTRFHASRRRMALRKERGEL
jgi:hypothetical protein